MPWTSGWDTLVVWAVVPLLVIVALSVPLLTAATVAGMVLGAAGPRIGRRLRTASTERTIRPRPGERGQSG